MEEDTLRKRKKTDSATESACQPSRLRMQWAVGEGEERRRRHSLYYDPRVQAEYDYHLIVVRALMVGWSGTQRYKMMEA